MPKTVRRAHVGVINEAMAQRYWPKRNPIGQRGSWRSCGISSEASADAPGDDQWVDIVGVVGDVRNDGLRKPVLPQVYVPYTLRALGAGLLLVRTPGSPGGITDALKRKVAEVNAEQPLKTSSSLEERLWEDGWARQQFAASLFSACAALALALAAVGIVQRRGGVRSHAARESLRCESPWGHQPLAFSVASSHPL